MFRRIYRIKLENLTVNSLSYHLRNSKKVFYYPFSFNPSHITHQYRIENRILKYKYLTIDSDVDGFNNTYYYRFKYDDNYIYLYEYKLMEFDEEKLPFPVDWFYSNRYYMKYKKDNILRISYNNNIKSIEYDCDKILDEDISIGLSFHLDRQNNFYALHKNIKKYYSQIKRVIFVEILNKEFTELILHKIKINCVEVSNLTIKKITIVGTEDGLYLLYKDEIYFKKISNLLKYEDYKYYTVQKNELNEHCISDITVNLAKFSYYIVVKNVFINGKILICKNSKLFIIQLYKLNKNITVDDYMRAVLYRVYNGDIDISTIKDLKAQFLLYNTGFFDKKYLIERAIEEKKENLIFDLIDFYKNMNRKNELREIFKEKNCFYFLKLIGEKLTEREEKIAIVEKRYLFLLNNFN